MKTFINNTLLLTLGSAICAFAVNAILVPSNFLSSGMTGFAILIHYKWNFIPVGLCYLLINIPIFLLSLRLVSIRFVLYTAWGMIIYTVMLFVPIKELSINDKLLSAIIAGGTTGLGIAIMLRSYGSAGGSEMICIMIYKISGISVGTGSLIINAVLLGISAFIYPLVDVLYTVVFIFISARITDMVFHGLAKRRTVMIISEKWNEILSEIMRTNILRATILKGKGGYLESEKSVLLSVVKSRHVSLIKAMAIRLDPNAFITIMEASDVTGENVGNQPRW